MVEIALLTLLIVSGVVQGSLMLAILVLLVKLTDFTDSMPGVIGHVDTTDAANLSETDEILHEIALAMRITQVKLDELEEHPYDEQPSDPTYSVPAVKNRLMELWIEFQCQVKDLLPDHNPTEEFNRLSRNWTDLTRRPPRVRALQREKETED